MTAPAFIHMGTLVRPHALKGELCVEWYADSPLRCGPIYLQCGREEPRPARIEAVRLHRGRPLVLLADIGDRNAAEAVRGAKLVLPKNELEPAAEDEVFLYQLVGLEVLLDQDGTRLGCIDHVEFPAGQELWVIRTDEGQEVLFPAVAEFVVKLDIARGQVRIAPPPGLLDLYLERSCTSPL